KSASPGGAIKTSRIVIYQRHERIVPCHSWCFVIVQGDSTWLSGYIYFTLCILSEEARIEFNKRQFRRPAMSETDRITDQMTRAYEGNAWHGPALRELLTTVTAETAAAKPLADRHSIWEIVLHVAAWKRVATRRVKGETVKEPPEGDWPPLPAAG